MHLDIHVVTRCAPRGSTRTHRRPAVRQRGCESPTCDRASCMFLLRRLDSRRIFVTALCAACLILAAAPATSSASIAVDGNQRKMSAITTAGQFVVRDIKRKEVELGASLTARLPRAGLRDACPRATPAFPPTHVRTRPACSDRHRREGRAHREWCVGGMDGHVLGGCHAATCSGHAVAQLAMNSPRACELT